MCKHQDLFGAFSAQPHRLPLTERMVPVFGLRKRLLHLLHLRTEAGPADFRQVHGQVEALVID